MPSEPQTVETLVRALRTIFSVIGRDTRQIDKAAPKDGDMTDGFENFAAMFFRQNYRRLRKKETVEKINSELLKQDLPDLEYFIQNCSYRGRYTKREAESLIGGRNFASDPPLGIMPPRCPYCNNYWIYERHGQIPGGWYRCECSWMKEKANQSSLFWWVAFILMLVVANALAASA